MDSRLNKEFADEIIKYACAREADEIARQYPDDLSHDFSESFQSGMKNFFSVQKRKERARKIKNGVLRACACVLIFLVIASITIYSVDAFRVPILNFISEIGKESTTLYAYTNEANYADFKDEIHGLYLPQYLPAGYTIKDIVKRDHDCTVVFANKENERILLKNISDISSTGIDNEDVLKEDITVNGKEARLYFGKSKNNLLFTFDKHTFLLTSEVNKVEMLKIAESMHFNK